LIACQDLRSKLKVFGIFLERSECGVTIFIDTTYRKKGGKKMKMGWKEIMQQVEQLNDGRGLRFKIPQTFGGGMAVIELNQNYPKNGGKKYLLKLGKDENVTPYSDSDKPKDLAKWVADRQGESV
jgi:hypothetical protein